jgi:endonuclease-3
MAHRALPIAKLLDLLTQAYPDARCALDHRDPFQLVVATILSAQCTDARVNVTTPALFARYPDAASLAAGNLEEVEALIRSTGFYHNKAKSLLGMAMALVARHGGQVPGDRAALALLPGVGQKTANVVLANAFGVPALAVDTHIFRVARRLGLSAASTPEKVEADLCRLFPERTWIDLHHQLIFHGRRVCEARKPACLQCTLRELCPTGSGRIPDPHSGHRLPGLPAGSALMPETAPVAAPGAGPMRIVSLVPSVTELLVQWGLASRLAARTTFCVEPPWIRASVPAAGGTKNPDLARIIALRPDLVIMERDENTLEAAQALEVAGLRLLVLEVRSVRDCLKAFTDLGEALGVPEAGRERAAALKALLKARPRKGPRTLTLIWKAPWMSSGPGTYVADLVRQAGFTPIGPDRYPVLSEADLDALEPDLILLPSEPYRFTKRDEAEMARRFPGARMRRLDGRGLTWYLSRTEEALKELRALG